MLIGKIVHFIWCGRSRYFWARYHYSNGDDWDRMQIIIKLSATIIQIKGHKVLAQAYIEMDNNITKSWPVASSGHIYEQYYQHIALRSGIDTTCPILISF